MKKPIVLTFVFFCSVLAFAIAGALFYRSIYHKRVSQRLLDGVPDRARIEQINRAREKQVAQEIEHEATVWRSARQILMGSEELTNAVRSAVQTEAGTLEASEKTKLSDAITCWLHSTATGSYEDFLAFRRPDSIHFETYESQLFLNGMSKKSPGLLAMTDADKCAALFKIQNPPKIASLAENGFSIVLTSATNWSDLDPHGSSRTDYILHNFYGGSTSYHEVSPCHYAIDPSEILTKDKAVNLALFSARLVTAEGKIVVPLHVVFFWSPPEKRWKPFELHMSLPVPLPKPGEKMVAFFF